MPAAARSAALFHLAAAKENRQRKGFVQARTQYRVVFFHGFLSESTFPPQLKFVIMSSAMRGFSLAVFSLLLLTAASFGGGAIAQPRLAPPASGWTVTWSDEFSSADGSAPDSTKWTYDLGGNGWGNQELETYTSRPQNVKIRNGNLVITAQKEKFTGTDGIARD